MPEAESPAEDTAVPSSVAPTVPRTPQPSPNADDQPRRQTLPKRVWPPSETDEGE